MAWEWAQATGTLSRNGRVVSRGYSGKGRGKNNPSLQGVAGLGPIPKGQWRIMGVYNSKNVGPFTLTVFADDGSLDDTHQETGRGAFRIHGDSIRAPGTASKGCIILPRVIREEIWRSGDRQLIVN
jgi:hypothetical protein